MQSNAAVEDGYKIIQNMAVQSLSPSGLYWRLAERFMGDTEMPVRVVFVVSSGSHLQYLSHSSTATTR